MICKRRLPDAAFSLFSLPLPVFQRSSISAFGFYPLMHPYEAADAHERAEGLPS
jgi:hypothetical protein